MGAAKIRIRSLIASMNKRKELSEYSSYTYTKNYFKKTDKEHTLLFPDMTPFHMPLLGAALQASNYKTVYLPTTTDNTIEIGLKYVNNDACYPAIIVTGQLIEALQSGKYDLNNTSVIISQTGGGCRATNYIGLIRKALKDAGFADISILSFNLSGLEKEQAFHFTLPILNRLLEAVIYGDLLMKLLYATRPYEINKGEAYKLYEQWQERCINSIKKGSIKEFRKNIKNIIRDFDNIEVKLTNRPKVGIVGEILIKYHSFGNDKLVDRLEAEGSEVCAPELMGFVKYCAYNGIAKYKLLKTGPLYAYGCKKVLDIIDWYERTLNREISKTRFRPSVNIYKLSENVDGILSLGNQTGEGWFLTGEMIEFIKEGINNIVCVQPFACLPNHIVGKAVIKKIRKLYPESNIVAIDYDPGASHTNQINRIKLMLTVAKEIEEEKEKNGI